MRTARVRVCGGDELRDSVRTLALEVADGDADVAIVDLADPASLAEAACLRRDLPRLVVAGEAERTVLTALDIPAERVVFGRGPAEIGPALVRLLPGRRRAPTSLFVVSGTRGGVGRTLLVTNLARRIAPSRHVCVVDATGSGAAAWWLTAQPGGWGDFEGVAGELSGDHVAVMAHEVEPGLRVVGGAGGIPSAALLDATIRACVARDDLVLVDAMPFAHGAPDDLARRSIVLTYDDPLSSAALDALGVGDDDWVIVSQSRAKRVGPSAVLRALPRDETSVLAALRSRARAGGALGRAYDEIAELVLVDAS